MPNVITTLTERRATRRERLILERELTSFTPAQRLDLDTLLDARGDDEATETVRRVLRRAAA